MDKIEKIVDSDLLGINETERIKSLSREEKRLEYLKICADADEKVRGKGIRTRRDVRIFKDIMAQAYGQHPNSEDFNIGMNLLAITTFLGLAGYYVGYQGIIRPIIEYFSR